MNRINNSHRLKVVYLIDHFRPTGGIKVLFQHVKLLRERGHDAVLLERHTKDFKDLWGFGFRPERVKSYSYKDMSCPDIIVATETKVIPEIRHLIKKVAVCHLSQGLEVLDLEEKIKGAVVPLKYRNSKLRYLFSRVSYLYKKKKIDAIYRLKTHKIAVSQNIKYEIEKRYSQNCYFVPNGINSDVFQPSGRTTNYKEKPINLLSVGPYNVACKGIPDLLDAVAILKSKGIDLRLTRVSYSSPTDLERNSGLVDRYLMNVSEGEMADLYRESHILIAPSLEAEGFGLPALEAMSCGVPCILTKVGSYLSFDDVHDYAYLVPVRSPKSIADAVVDIVKDDLLRAGLIVGGTRVAQKYSLDNTGRSLEAVFFEILRERKEHPKERSLECRKKNSSFVSED